MEIVYSKHAVIRMQERKITPAEVETVVLHPDGSIKQTLDKWIYYKEIPNRIDYLIAVVSVIKKISQIEVITVMVHFEVLR